MGIDLGELCKKEPIGYPDLRDRVIAIDAYNVLHQFLASIRSRNGMPLKDANGHITSHFSGLLYRNANLIEARIRPVYVFDGSPHALKMAVIKKRQQRREQAEREWQEALEKGDLQKARVKAQQTSRVTDEILRQSIEFLEALGIPFVMAPSEGEAQASYMVKKGDAYAVGSQDFDCLLFGAPLLVRNLTSSGRRKLPSKNAYVKVSPEMIRLKPTLKRLQLLHKQLIDVAIMMGTDFNKGIHGYGPKKSVKAIQKDGNVENALAHIGGKEVPTFEEVNKIRDIFLNPNVTDEYQLYWSVPDTQAVKRILCDEHQFSSDRVEQVLEKFSHLEQASKQRNLFEFSDG